MGQTGEEATSVEPTVGAGSGTAAVDGEVGVEGALVDEAMRKSWLIWVTSPDLPQARAFWHVWLAGVVYLLTGPGEQPDPGLSEGATVSVVVRSKDTTERLVVYDVRVSRLRPDAEDWDTATRALAAGRLNLHDAEHAPQRWTGAEFVLYRLTPTGHVTEQPGCFPSESLRAAPVQTAATTAGRQPWILHRRGHRGRPLS